MNKAQKYNFSIDTKAENAIMTICKSLKEIINDIYTSHQNIVVLCIGTDRSTGDSLGPLVGTRLSEALKGSNITVLGTLHEPVHAKNIGDNIEYINSSISNPFVIAIDASLGRVDKVGYVSIFDGPIRPGAGVNKSLPHIGDIGITGVINVSGFMEYMVLQNTRLSLVMDLAEKIASSIYFTLKDYSFSKFSARA
ncbi:spore protease YyaC [Clostridium cylindrosporum]|uniref:Putative sporulation protein YyaC n=1 Tax=Clostridium cylindrosporum DSM 605 TaxID=1121307 RepID=A0A0J8D6Q3_CLOCY|nr:spore protease YyaC [Clostridium cylindrosporum]KMT21765.1 putative sporulation protein YyaC [Clostridium cylindrosporum DSM 605]